MTTKFAQLVTALEEAGVVENEAYAIANQVDLIRITDVKKAAQELAQEHAEWIEALEWIEESNQSK